MSLRGVVVDLSCGNELRWFWRPFRLRERARTKWGRDVLTFFVNRSAQRHGGYIGNGAVIDGIPVLPHGLRGVYISRYARIGRECWIYQNVTIGEAGRRAPRIGDRCLIGANAVLVGDITIGDDVKVGAGAVVSTDIPSGSTVVAQPPRILTGGGA